MSGKNLTQRREDAKVQIKGRESFEHDSLGRRSPGEEKESLGHSSLARKVASQKALNGRKWAEKMEAPWKK
jgi:hypothetical protein